ncbi:MAG: hypothetical protein JWR84_2858 [Caulobacter sp.]|nr:hypothetical protein [Caulobacter sp.]
MPPGRLLLLLALTAPLAVAAPAQAGKKVPSAEQGSVPLVLDAPVGLETPVTIQPGQIAWRETLRPERNVRLLDAAPERKRPGAPAVPAGAVLFGYRLGSGVAYCPSVDQMRGSVTTQCFRDFNRDGKFEGGYVTDYQGEGSRYLTGFVHALGPAPNLRYERLTIAEAVPTGGHFVFVGFRGQVAQFRFALEEAKMDILSPCQPIAGGACTLNGLTLRIEPAGAAARISLLTASPNRQIQINMTGLSLPGPGS